MLLSLAQTETLLAFDKVYQVFFCDLQRTHSCFQFLHNQTSCLWANPMEVQFFCQWEAAVHAPADSVLSPHFTPSQLLSDTDHNENTPCAPAANRPPSLLAVVLFCSCSCHIEDIDTGRVVFDHGEIATYALQDESCHEAHRSCRVACRDKLDLKVSAAHTVFIWDSSEGKNDKLPNMTRKVQCVLRMGYVKSPKRVERYRMQVGRGLKVRLIPRGRENQQCCVDKLLIRTFGVRFVLLSPSISGKTLVLDPFTTAIAVHKQRIQFYAKLASFISLQSVLLLDAVLCFLCFYITISWLPGNSARTVCSAM